MDLIRRLTVFAIAAVTVPATMMIGTHLSFPANSTAKIVSGSKAEVPFVNVKLNENESVKTGNDNNVSENNTASNPVISNNHSQIPKSKNPYFRLFYFSGKSVYETNLASLLKK